MNDDAGERGFTLLEVVFCVAVLAMVSAATVGMFAGIARRAMPEQTRALASMVAQNTLVRARAAASYAPNALPNPDVSAVRGYVDSRAWVLGVGTQTFAVAGKLVSPAALCGKASTLLVPLTVTTDYEEPSPSMHTFAVTVVYPVNPCAPGQTSTLTLTENLPAVAFAPGTRVTHDVGAPPMAQ